MSSNPVTPGMTPEQMKKFFEKPVLMDIATITPGGYPHVTPVWFEYDGENFLVSTTPDRKKARNLKRNPKAGFSIAEHDLPYAAVVGYGDVVMENDTEGKLLERLAQKYLPEEKAQKYFEELMEAGPRVTLKIKPRWILSWTGK